jgi:hypothetical protein
MEGDPKEGRLYYYNPVVTKKKIRIKKRRVNPNTNVKETYSSDMSGEDSDCYMKVQEFDPFKYNDLEDLEDPLKVNKGFKLQPLPPEIYGFDKARKSKLKFKRKNDHSTTTTNPNVNKQGNSTFINF